MKVSVIIPVFNTAPWLDRCLDAVLRQTLSDIEILCIEDGSTDESGSILEKRAARDSRIRILSFGENRGAAASRNAGLDAAGGEYVYFLDSDDWMDPDYLEAMVLRAEKTGGDVVINRSYILEWEDGRQAPAFPADFVRGDGYYTPAVVSGWFLPALWTRLYRRSYLKDNDIRFPDDLRCAEDIYFTGLAEVLQRRSYLFTGPMYHYFQREGSLSRASESRFRALQNYDRLFDALVMRGYPVSDLRLFYAGPDLRVDTEEKFLFLRRFFHKIAPLVREHAGWYFGFDKLLLDAVTGSASYGDFQQRYGANYIAGFIRNARSVSPSKP
ncbi:MAG: glycosyltransferase family 2 protein [Bacteroidales bacterium]|nr:glycosyltransferase family 2 protein [Bacteroidales bacterium]